MNDIKEIYFDNSATTMIDKDVVSAMDEINKSYYANPSAMHHLGFLAENKVKEARQIIAKLIGSCESEIIFTSGGSESNNTAILGTVSAYKKIGNHIITTLIEHDSVKKVFKKLEDEGVLVDYLKVDKTGHIDIDDLINLVTEKTILVSIMYVNNEIGAVQDIEKIGRLLKQKNKNTVFHVDFVQGFGKYQINVKKDCIDLLSISSHKFNGPKGVGVLYQNKDIRLNPLIIGGLQQNGMRAGTLNVPGIVGTAVAANNAYDNLNITYDKLKELRDYAIKELIILNDWVNEYKKTNGVEYIHLNTISDDTFAPHIVSVSFVGIKAEVMLHALEEKYIYISSGSACSTHDKSKSTTLMHIGVNDAVSQSAIRISFGKQNKKSEIDDMISALHEILPMLYKTVRYKY